MKLLIYLFILLFLSSLLIFIDCKQQSTEDIFIGETLYQNQDYLDNRELISLIEQTLDGDKEALSSLVTFPCGGASGCYDLGFVITQIINKLGEDEFIKMVEQLDNNERKQLEGFIQVGLEYGYIDKEKAWERRKIENQFPKLDRLFYKKESKLKSNDESVEIPANNHKLDLDSLINVWPNQYLLTFKNSDLDICYIKQFELKVQDYSLFAKSLETYTRISEDEIDTLTADVYTYKESYLKEYFNDHPDVKQIDIAYGKIVNEKILLTHGIRVGMAKDSILNKIFKSTNTFDSVSKLTIYKDEFGDDWVILNFAENKLSEVIFDSFFNWIEKDLPHH